MSIKILNSKTGKLVNRLQDRSKDKLTWIKSGSPIKQLIIPIQINAQLLSEQAKQAKLLPDYCLFLLSKITYNRLRHINKDDAPNWFEHGYVQLSSKELEKWIGRNYIHYINFLERNNYIEALFNENTGAKSYYNSKICVRYRIKAEHIKAMRVNGTLRRFKQIEIYNYKLINKLEKKHNDNKIMKQTKKSHSIIAEMLTSVRLDLNACLTYLEINNIDISLERIEALILKINSGDISYKNDLDIYGERFHSDFTYHWSVLRKFIFIDGKENEQMYYLDQKNSQYLFLSVMDKFKDLIPEFKSTIKIFESFNDTNFNLFKSLCQAGTIYEFIRDSFINSNLSLVMFNKKTDTNQTYDLSKYSYEAGRKIVKNLLMCTLFSSYQNYRDEKAQLANFFPSVIKFINTITFDKDRNILPEILQKLESRTLLDNVVMNAVGNGCNNIITIHDGFICTESEMKILTATYYSYFDEFGLKPEIELKNIKQL